MSHYRFFSYLFFVATSATLPPGEDVVEPLSLIAAPVMVPLAVNVCFTLGPLGESLWRAVFRIRTRRIGRLMMQAGLAFSLFVVLAPSVCWGIVWVWHLVVGHRVNAL